MATHARNVVYLYTLCCFRISLPLSSREKCTTLDTGFDFWGSSVDARAMAKSTPSTTEIDSSQQFFCTCSSVGNWCAYSEISLSSFRSDSKTANEMGYLWCY